MNKKIAILTLILISFSSWANHDSSEEVAKEFFAAFKEGAPAKMNQLYANDINDLFEDPFFGPLSTKETRAMWNMLLSGPAKIEINYSLANATEDTAIVSWNAKYTFGEKKREIFNQITSVFKVENGKIVRQRDTFDACKWVTMAMEKKVAAQICLNPAHLKRQFSDKLKAYIDSQK